MVSALLSTSPVLCFDRLPDSKTSRHAGVPMNDARDEQQVLSAQGVQSCRMKERLDGSLLKERLVVLPQEVVFMGEALLSSRQNVEDLLGRRMHSCCFYARLRSEDDDLEIGGKLGFHCLKGSSSGSETGLQIRGLPEKVFDRGTGKVSRSKTIISSPLPSWMSSRMQAEEGIVQSGVDTWSEEEDEASHVSKPAQTQRCPSGFVASEDGVFAVNLKEEELTFEQWLESPTSESQQEELAQSRSSSFDSQWPHVASSGDLDTWGEEPGFARSKETLDAADSQESYWADPEEENVSVSLMKEVSAGGKKRQWGKGGRRRKYIDKYVLAEGGKKHAPEEKSKCTVEQSIVKFGKRPARLMRIYKSLKGLEAVG